VEMVVIGGKKTRDPFPRFHQFLVSSGTVRLRKRPRP
jgi:hypothetical protein